MDPGDPDEPSRKELESRVEQLEETVSKMLPDRRGVIKGLGAAAVGGAAVGASSGGASGQSAAGQVGTSSEPVDTFAFDLDVQGALQRDLDAGEQAITNAGSVSTDELNNVVWADASKDGATAVSDALDKIPDGEKGILAFEPGAVYEFDNNVTVSPADVARIEGNGAYLNPTSDVVCLDIQGNKTDTGAAPDQDNRQLAEEEMGIVVSGLRSYNNADPYVGTAIRVQNVFGIKVTECNLTKVDTAIEFTATNRDIIVTNNEIYDCTSYCIHFDDGDMHQVEMTDNHIGYADILLKIGFGDYADFLIADNDFEAGINEIAGHTRIIDAQPDGGGNLWDTRIVDNTLEGHGVSTHAVFVRSGDTSTAAGVRDLQIKDNYISEGDDLVEVAGAINVSICNNQFIKANDNGSNISITGAIQGCQISDNTVNNADVDNQAEGIVVDPTGGNVFPVAIENNSFILTENRCIHITDANTGNGIFAISVRGNQMYMNNDTTTNSFICDINLSGGGQAIHVQDNFIRGRGSGESGYRVSSSSGFDKAVVSNNIIRGTISGTAFDIPSSATGIVVKDNIGP